MCVWGLALGELEWPDDVREALRQFKLPAPRRSPGAPLLSMPAAELFTTVALAAAAAETKPHHAVVAVGDCDPAASQGSFPSLRSPFPFPFHGLPQERTGLNCAHVPRTPYLWMIWAQFRHAFA